MSKAALCSCLAQAKSDRFFWFFCLCYGYGFVSHEVGLRLACCLRTRSPTRSMSAAGEAAPSPCLAGASCAWQARRQDRCHVGDQARSLFSVFMTGVLPGRVSLLQLLTADLLRPPCRTEVVPGIGLKLYAASCKSACCMPCICSFFSVLSLGSPSAFACFCLPAV